MLITKTCVKIKINFYKIIFVYYNGKNQILQISLRVYYNELKKLTKQVKTLLSISCHYSNFVISQLIVYSLASNNKK